jgi:hypothetical protein
MERCHGKTKSGDRCKRSAREGAQFCSMHAEQAEDTPEAGGPGGGAARGRDLFDVAIGLAVVGFALGGAFAFRRLFRFP